MKKAAIAASGSDECESPQASCRVRGKEPSSPGGGGELLPQSGDQLRPEAGAAAARRSGKGLS